MNLLDVTKNLQTEDQCLDFIEKVRWPDGKVRCIQCGSDKLSRITRTVDETKTRKQKKQNKRTRLYACLEPTCKHRFTPTVGTLFHDSHLPLTKWFMAVALVVHAKKSMSAKQIERHLGINYRTAWYMGHRIRKAMTDGAIAAPASRPKLQGVVEVDETWIGGKTRGQGAGQTNKEIVMGIRERGGDLRLFHIPDASAKSIAKPMQENVSPNVQKVMTDEYPAYPLVMMASGIRGSQHFTIRHRDKIYVRGDVYTNTVESAFSLFKRGIIGSFHSVSGKHLHRYLSEFEFRFNKRDNQAGLFSATVANMVKTREMKYRELIAN